MDVNKRISDHRANTVNEMKTQIIMLEGKITAAQEMIESYRDIDTCDALIGAKIEWDPLNITGMPDMIKAGFQNLLNYKGSLHMMLDAYREQLTEYESLISDFSKPEDSDSHTVEFGE